MGRWDVKAPWYSAVRRIPPFALILRAELRNLRFLLDGVASDLPRVLEVGIGTGDASEVLPGKILIGCDRSRAMLQSARTRLPGLIGFVADASALPVRSGSFPFVAAIGLTEYLRHPKALLAECRRVLLPGGHLLITRTPTGPLATLRRLLGAPLFPIGERRWKRILTEGGWEIVGERRSLFQVQYLIAPSSPKGL